MSTAISVAARLGQVGFGASLVLVALVVHAGGMEIKEGSWEMKSTTKNPMTGEPQTFTSTQCVDRAIMDPESFINDAEGCSISDVQTSSSSMRWTMTCAAPGGQMKGSAQIKSSGGGAQVAGSMNMEASFSGQTMNFSTDWTGRWVGPCD